MLVHASCVAFDGNAILLRGSSGSGKSDLALRLIHDGASLVADDQVIIEATVTPAGDRRLMASAPPALAGLLEVRGIGIVRCDAVDSAAIRLVIDLGADAAIERLPAADSCTLLGIDLPRFTLRPFEASTPAKMRVALGQCLRPG